MVKILDAWFRNPPTNKQTELNLFCFPYAGGTSLIFRDWGKRLHLNLQVIPVELPGRGSRLKEAPFVRMYKVVEALASIMEPFVNEPFAFFGHSMGSLIAFELARTLKREHNREPQALFVSGRRAPQIPDNDPATYNLPNDEFIKELQRLNGTPKEVWDNPELIELILPLVRADFESIQTYEYQAGPLLACPIIGFGGLDDHDENRDLIDQWRQQTTSRFASYMLPGDHFFLKTSETQLLRLLAQELHQVMRLCGDVR